MQECTLTPEEYKALVEQSPILIWRANTRAECDYFNDRWLEFTGRAFEQEYGNGWAEGVHADDLQECLKIYQEAFARRQMFEMEYRLRRHDGAYRWLFDRGVPFFHPDGVFAGYIGSCVDVTEKVEAQDALALREAAYRESEEKFATAFQTSSYAITITHAGDGAFVEVNHAFTSLTGFTRAEALANSSVGLDLWVDRDDRELVVSELREGRPVVGRVCSFRRKNGETFTGLLSAQSIRLGNESCVLASINDITEQISLAHRLAENHDMLLNLTRLVPGVVYQYRLWTDGRSAFPYASPGMNDIYEVTPEAVREDATPVFGRLHPDDFDHVVNAIQESARTLRTFYCEFRVILPRQGLRWRWSQAQPERMEDGSTLWHGIISDITERKQAEEERTSLRGQLDQAQKMESIGRLAGGLAHDFNNMLGVILGYTELAREQVDPVQPLHANLAEIQKAATRSAHLTRQLLAFARKQVVSPKVLDLNDTVDDMLKMLGRLIGEDIALTWRPAAGLWLVKVDPSQIDQILTNLLVNARDAITGVGRVTIETRHATFDEAYCHRHAGLRPGEYVQLAVSDNGDGMAKETQAHVFEPFFTTKEQGKGTGLGLSTVYGIVKQNDGFIDVYSQPGHGTTFTISLPRHVGQAEQAPMGKSANAGARGHEMILLVEDERAFAAMTTGMLEQQGYTVVEAHTPGEAIRLATDYAGEVHLLMTDVIMPEMNGRDLARTLLPVYPHLRLLFMSGYSADVLAHRGVLDAEMNFLQKPFSTKELAAKVREALDRE